MITSHQFAKYLLEHPDLQIFVESTLHPPCEGVTKDPISIPAMAENADGEEYEVIIITGACDSLANANVDLPETDVMASMRRTHQEWITHSQQLERERDKARRGHRSCCGVRDHWKAEALRVRAEAVRLLKIYRERVPLGHQPHMMAAEVDKFLSENAPVVAPATLELEPKKDVMAGCPPTLVRFP